MCACRQPWVLEVAACGGSPLLARGDDEDAQVPELLKPLMQGAWLVSTRETDQQLHVPRQCTSDWKHGCALELL
jgi:hypothetical protein